MSVVNDCWRYSHPIKESLAWILALLPVWLPTDEHPGSQQRWLKYLGPCCLNGELRLYSGLLASAWHRPSLYGHLGSKPVDGRSIIHFSLSAFRLKIKRHKFLKLKEPTLRACTHSWQSQESVSFPGLLTTNSWALWVNFSAPSFFSPISAKLLSGNSSPVWVRSRMELTATWIYFTHSFHYREKGRGRAQAEWHSSGDGLSYGTRHLCWSNK